MKRLPRIRNAHHLRKSHYVDETLQKFLLVGLVLLEVGLAVGFAWMMYRHLNQIIEESLYRVHLADAVPMLAQLMHEALILLGIFSAANLLALVVVDLIWRRHVSSILRLFMQLMRKTLQLDFTADAAIGDHHQLLDLAAIQREQDRTRLTAIRDQLSRLEPEMLAANDAHAMHDVLNALDALVPKRETTLPAMPANDLT